MVKASLFSVFVFFRFDMKSFSALLLNVVVRPVVVVVVVRMFAP